MINIFVYFFFLEWGRFFERSFCVNRFVYLSGGVWIRLCCVRCFFWGFRDGRGLRLVFY